MELQLKQEHLFNWVKWRKSPSSPYWNCYAVTAHYNDVIMSATVSQITSLTIVIQPFIQGADQRKHQTSASLAFVRGIHRDR